MKREKMVGVLLSFVLTSMVSLGSTNISSAEMPGKTVVLQVNSTTATINGISTTLDVAPYVDPSSNRTLVPIRFISESLGYIVLWNGTDRTVQILDKSGIDIYDYSYKDDATGEFIENFRSVYKYKYAKLQIGSNVATVSSDYKIGERVNLKDVTIEQAPVIMNGRTMLPIRFVAEQMNVDVAWDNATKKITLSAKGENYIPQAIETAMDSFAKPADTNTVYKIEDDPAYVKSGQPENYFLKVSKDLIYYKVDLAFKDSSTAKVMLSGLVVGINKDKAYIEYQLAGESSPRFDGYLQAVDNGLSFTFTNANGEKCSVTFPN